MSTPGAFPEPDPGEGSSTAPKTGIYSQARIVSYQSKTTPSASMAGDTSEPEMSEVSREKRPMLPPPRPTDRSPVRPGKRDERDTQTLEDDRDNGIPERSAGGSRDWADTDDPEEDESPQTPSLAGEKKLSTSMRLDMLRMPERENKGTIMVQLLASRPDKIGGGRPYLLWLESKMDYLRNELNASATQGFQMLSDGIQRSEALAQEVAAAQRKVEELNGRRIASAEATIRRLDQQLKGVEDKWDKKMTTRAEKCLEQSRNFAVGYVQEQIKSLNDATSSTHDHIYDQVANLETMVQSHNGHIQALLAQTGREPSPEDPVLQDLTNRLRNVGKDPKAPRPQTTFPIPTEGVRLGAFPSQFREQGAPSPRMGAGGGRGDPGDDGDDDGPDGPKGPRRNNDSRFPRDDRYRENTYETGGTGASHSGSIKIKREDIGQFNPHHEDADHVGVVADGKTLVFTDVFSFIDRINTFLEDEATRDDAARQIASFFQTLLGGPAAMWWSNEVAAERRRQLRQAGLLAMLDALIFRFNPDAATATRDFNESSLSLRDIAEDDHAMNIFVQKKLRWARAMGILDIANANWQGVMVQIWSSMDLRIRQYVQAPRRQSTLADYMQGLEESRAILLAAAYEQYPHLQKKPSSRKSSSKAEDRHSSKSSFSSHSRREEKSSSRSHKHSSYRDRDRDRDRGSVRFDKPRDQGRSSDKYRSGDRERDNRRRDDRDRERRRDDRPRDYDRNRHRDRDRPRDRDRDRDRPRDKVHLADGQDDSGTEADASDSESVASTSSADTEIAYVVFDTDLMCHKCHKVVNGKSELRLHVKACRGTGPLRAQKNHMVNMREAERRTCGYCSTIFGSRNELFRHLKHCEDAKDGAFRRPADPEIDTATPAISAQHVESEEDGSDYVHYLDDKMSTKQYRLRDAPQPKPKVEADSPLGNNTYLRVESCTHPDHGERLDICLDTGASRSVIGRHFLDKLRHTIEHRKGKVSGVGSRMRLKEWATFDIYLPGIEDDQPTLVKFQHSAWVVDSLAPNLLLGTDFLDPYEAIIDYGRQKATLQTSGFEIPFTVFARGVPCVRKVKTTRAITLLRNQEVEVPVEYKPLPKGRSFMFNSEHAAVHHAVITAKTAKVVSVKNTTQGMVTIPKRTPVGKIGESRDSGFFACSWTSAIAALAAGTALTAMVTPEVSVDIDPVSVAMQRTSSLPLDKSFELSRSARAVAEHGFGRRQATPVPAMDLANASTSANFASTESDTPLSDYVFQLTQLSDQAADTQDIAPLMPEKQSTLGLRMDASLPEIVTDSGVHVFAADKNLANKFVKLVEDSPTLGTDKGLINQAPDDLMRVPLVEGWQNQKVNARSYPLSRKDRELLDSVFDGLHQQGRMTWATRATPFAHPVFVVWRPGKGGVPKGRVVIDLRALNRVSVPDNYPLPLQSEIIAELRGKSYITAIDATQFFYQFGVHPPHQDRFTLISPRGLEKPTVCLMGYRNSPAHVQRVMDQLLKPFAGFARAFIDDIVIFSDTAEDHLRHLKRLFRLFTDKNIAISPTKSYIGYPGVELLGFRVDSLGLTTTAQRVQAFRDLAFPATLKVLEQWIGATGFLRHLIPYYAQLLEPLQTRKTELLAKGRKEGRLEAGNHSKRANYCAKASFEPTDSERLSFKAIQDVICKDNPTILHHSNPDKTLFLQVDGCLERGFGVMVFHTRDGYIWEPGSVIPSNQVLPVMFLSRCLTKAEMCYGPSEQEVACLVWAVRKLRTMIHSSRLPVNVLTDHASTRGIVEQTRLDTSSTDRANRRLITASVYLSEYDLKVFHLPGRLNFVPDALSRLRALQDPVERPEGEVILDSVMFAFAEARMEATLKQQFIEGYRSDDKYAAIIKDLVGDADPAEDSRIFSRPGLPFVIADGLLYNVRPAGLRSLCVPHALLLHQ